MVPFISFAVAARRWHMPAAVRFALCAVCGLAALNAQAQAQAHAPAKAARPDPLDAKASVPALRYLSSLSTYRRGGDDQPVSWRDANDTVTRIGGWRAYAREAPQPDPLPAAKPGDAAAATKPADAAASAKPMPAGHGGHAKP